MSRNKPASPPHVRVEHLTRSFVEGAQRHVVLDDLSITVNRGETVALRGRSGSGKSTLLNLISGIDTADSGVIDIDGLIVTELGEYERTLFRRRHIGFVYQSFNLIPTLSVADNVRLVLELNDTPGPDADRRVHELLADVGLDGRATSYPDILSGGEQQRVAIARALAHRPTLLLADEPTGNLDDKTAAQALRLLLRLVAEAGATMIVATHSNAVAEACDRSVSLSLGRAHSEPAPPA